MSGAATQGDDRPLPITFVLPHGNPTSGGVYVAESLAAELAKVTDVRIILGSRSRRRRRSSTVRTEYGAPRRHAFFAGERVLVYGDAADAHSLAPPGTVPILLLQGIGSGNEDAVEANLRRFDHVVVVSKWLGELAQGHGCETFLAPPSLDQSVFFPGPPAGDRAASVAMLVHPEPSKRCVDGVRALVTVGRQRPDVPIRVFGKRWRGSHKLTRPLRDGPQPAHLLGPLSRVEVAELMRSSAVFACSSELEGFGLPGLEALACGAALATTDAKGTRDYASDGRTALVSPPRRPQELAENICRLLEDATLRTRLGSEGQGEVAESFPTWSQTACRLYEWLAGIDE